VTVDCGVPDVVCANPAAFCTIEFLTVTGSVPLIQVVKVNINSASVGPTTAGTKEYAVCSNRGLCNEKTGNFYTTYKFDDDIVLIVVLALLEAILPLVVPLSCSRLLLLRRYYTLCYYCFGATTTAAAVTNAIDTHCTVHMHYTQTGVCKCFPGYGSSNGQNGQGSLGECGFVLPFSAALTIDDVLEWNKVKGA
jgi:hypothetical protein